MALVAICNDLEGKALNIGLRAQRFSSVSINRRLAKGLRASFPLVLDGLYK